MDNHIDKKQKMSQDQKQAHESEIFETVGEQAQHVNDEEEQTPDLSGLRNTGAEDAEGHPVQEIESLCMNCHENGVTRLLLTKIPFFREVILMSFECPHCNFKNSEIQPAAQIAEKGSRYILKIENKKDFNRQVVKSEFATVKFVELDIEIPPKRGQLTNVEGLLSEMVEDLESDQPQRLAVQPEVYKQIADIIARIQACINAEPGTLPLTFTIDDPSGNSWIEFQPGEPAHKWANYEYNRTPDQNVFLGLISADDVEINRREEVKLKEEKKVEDAKKAEISAHTETAAATDGPKVSGFLSDETEIENLTNEVQTFTATCGSCYKPCETHMKTVNIPHFKDVIIMSTVCDYCGYKSNEVKTGGAIPDKGRKITLKVTDPDDLARDILKSETCGMSIPELNLDLTPGTLGGRFTTIEGLLAQVLEELHSRVFTQTSDSLEEETKNRWTTFFERLEEAKQGKIPFTIIMEDPLASSYIQNVYAPDPDPNMTIEDLERSDEQNEDLGLNDMKVEDADYK